MIEIKDLYKSFGKKKVLKGVSCRIPDGEVMCIIGKSGCGKSVLIKHIVGLLDPDSGTVQVDGEIVSKLGRSELFEFRKKIGFVFQGAALFDSFNVYENIVLSLYEHGQKDRQVLENEAMRVLSSVGLLPNLSNNDSDFFRNEWNLLKEKMPSDLSGGMRKRLGVARALVGSPNYILYDEPTTGLDPVNSEQIDGLIANLANQLNVTSIVITHDMFSVQRVADRVVMLNDGIVQFAGTTRELYESDDDFVKEFLLRYEK